MIDDAAKAKLRRNIKKRGLLDTLVVNERTMNLVSGHQRLAIVDALEGTDNYSLTVAMVSLTNKEEREQNAFFNNANAMGTWDAEKVKAMLDGTDLDFKEMGFELEDLNTFSIDTNKLFESDPAAQASVDALNAIRPATPEPPISVSEGDAAAPASETDEAAKTANTAEIKQLRKDYKERKMEENDTEFYLVVVFRNRAHREQFLGKYGLDKDTRYLSAEAMEKVVDEVYGASK